MAADPQADGADPARHAWQRMIVWHCGFGALVVITAAVAVIEDVSGARLVAFFAGLILVSGWYAAVGARALRRESARLGYVYLTLAGAIVIALFALHSVGALMLFVYYPHIWMVLPFRRAVVGTVASVAAVAAVMLARSGLHPQGLREAFVLTAVGLLVALLLGTWISKVIEQSRLRAEFAAVSREAGVLAERERLAGEIHDTLAQGFTGILLLLDAAESELSAEQDGARRHLALARRSARENLAEARALVAMASPVHLARAPFPEALAQMVERVGGETGIDARYQTTGRHTALPVGHEVALFRVLQESLANVRKHARASVVEVDLSYQHERVSVAIRDDGLGFDETSTSVEGFGLTGMRRRVEGVGGTVSVRSSPGAGTVVRAELPSAVTD